ncbi:MAG: hypothetical protein ABIJ65_07575 [Chloroflexota bacterium]
MKRKAFFEGLIVDEEGRQVTTAYVGDDPCYVIDDNGFSKHILSEKIDYQVLELMREQMAGKEDMLSEQTAKMLGTDDIFSRAMIETQLKNIDQQFDSLLDMGIPEESRVYMGMLGFKIVINIHGEVVKLDQPASRNEEDGDEE